MLSMYDIFNSDGRTAEGEPAITKWGYEDLEDDPSKHRWRAWWVGGNGVVMGISLIAYPVIKETPCGVWISEHSYRQATKQPWEEGAPAKEWVEFDPKCDKKRFINNGSGQAWAKPTQDKAVRSLAIRMSRWSNHLANEVDRLRSAADVMEKLRPDLPSYVEHARRNLRSMVR